MLCTVQSQQVRMTVNNLKYISQDYECYHVILVLTWCFPYAGTKVPQLQQALAWNQEQQTLWLWGQQIIIQGPAYPLI